MCINSRVVCRVRWCGTWAWARVWRGWSRRTSPAAGGARAACSRRGARAAPARRARWPPATPPTPPAARRARAAPAHTLLRLRRLLRVRDAVFNLHLFDFFKTLINYIVTIRDNKFISLLMSSSMNLITAINLADRNIVHKYECTSY